MQRRIPQSQASQAISTCGRLPSESTSSCASSRAATEETRPAKAEQALACHQPGYSGERRVELRLVRQKYPAHRKFEISLRSRKNFAAQVRTNSRLRTLTESCRLAVLKPPALKHSVPISSEHTRT